MLGTNLHWMRGPSVLCVAPLDLFVKFAHVLKKQTVCWELWEHSRSAYTSDPVTLISMRLSKLQSTTSLRELGVASLRARLQALWTSPPSW